MKYLTLSDKLPDLSAICLGTATLGLDPGLRDSYELLDAFVAAGGNFIDTAEVYSDWIAPVKSRSEKAIGRWLADRGMTDRVVVATKGGHPRLDSMHISRMGRAEIAADIEASLRNLGLDCLPLYYLHRDDPAREVAEIMETLAGFVETGKVAHIACSNWPTQRIRAANAYARSHGLPEFIVNQVQWSLAKTDEAAERDPSMLEMDEDMYDYHDRTSMAVAAYSSQARGFFSLDPDALGPASPDTAVPKSVRNYVNPVNLDRLRRTHALADRIGCTSTQAALAWLLSRPMPVVALVGTSKVHHLKDACGAADLELTDRQADSLAAGSGAKT